VPRGATRPWCVGPPAARPAEPDVAFQLSGYSEGLYQRQIRRERQALAGAKLKYTRLGTWGKAEVLCCLLSSGPAVDDAVQREAGGQLPAAKLLLNRWFAPLVEAIKCVRTGLRQGLC